MWQSLGFETYPVFQSYTAKVLVVGGGGGSKGIGGGGGEVLYNSGYTIPNTTPFTVTVGAAVGTSTNGNNSVFGTMTGRGGKTGTSSVGGASGNGHTGGGSEFGRGGGGGDSQNGQQGGPNGNAYGGYGGAGTSNDISGTTTYYGGGGGGSADNPSAFNGGVGGSSVGGHGNNGNDTGLSSPVANSGGGGGGSFTLGATGGADGLVIVRYTSGTQRGTGGDSIYQIGGDFIHVFTGSGTYTPTL